VAVAILVLAFAIIVFVAVRLRDMDLDPEEQLEAETPRESLESLRTVVEGSPSFANRIKLAKRLVEESQTAEAVTCLEQALSTHPDDREALLLLGEQRMQLERWPAAIDALSRLIDLNFGYEDYLGAEHLTRALFQDGRRDDAFGLLESLIESSNRLDHRVELAKYQLEANLGSAAEATLQQALEFFEALSEESRRRNGTVATEARRLLRTLQQS
jgi:tetratricopeptide (TPR) repeat protein